MKSKVSNQNPFVSIRNTYGLGQAEFSRALGVSQALLWQAESGTSANPRSVIEALSHLGHDSAQLAFDYSAWRQSQAEILRLKLVSTVTPERGR